jgi:undecaprenyl-diphosphatase
MFEAIVLGVVQGLTEFLPISSTAHLVIVPRLFGWDGELVNSLGFDVALHAGTLLSVLVCLRKDIADMLRARSRLLWMIAAATVPAALAGLFLEDYVSGVFRSPGLIAGTLVLFGIVMYVSERFGGRGSIASMKWTDAMIIGCAQALALVPGVSRSGITISAGLVRGIRRDEAARFSFLLSIPVIAGAGGLEGRHLLSGPGGTDMALVAAGFSASFITGAAAIRFLLKFLRDYTLNVFVYYRFMLAGVILGWLWLAT